MQIRYGAQNFRPSMGENICIDKQMFVGRLLCFQPILLVARSKAWVCDRSHPGIVVSNTVG